MPSDAPSPDALLDEAIADLILQATKSEWGDSPALLAAEGRLRAAVRRLAEQGEGDIEEVWSSADGELHITVSPQHFEAGQKVRVTRIEEAP